MKGFTLIELLVVISIISVLTFISAVSVINFQKEAKLDSFTKEFVSALETARNRSVTGVVPDGVTGFESYNEPGDELPFWVVDIASNKYSIYSKYKKATDPSYFPPTNSEDTQIPAGYSINPNLVVDFKRLTGKTTPVSFTVLVAGYSQTETVNIDENGLVKIP